MRPLETRDDAWLTTEEVATRLGVKKATVYAYVSRGLLSGEKVGRQSRFRLTDVQSLLDRIHPGDASGSQGPSKIFSLRDGELYYRGHRVLDLADSTPFEEVAHLLWEVDDEAWPDPDPAMVEVVHRGLSVLPATVTVIDQLKMGVAILEALDEPGSTYHRPEVLDTSRRLYSNLVAGLPRRSTSDENSRFRIAARLWRRLSPHPARPEEIEVLNAALVLAAEHGLAPSTTVARTAASLGAPVYGVVAAGMGAGTSDVEGSSALMVEDLLRSIKGSPERVRGLVQLSRFQGRVPGFGHGAYPGGDSRAAHLLARLDTVAAGNPRHAETLHLRKVMRSRGLPPPNFYFAIASLVHTYEMAPGSTEGIFELARSVGWITHALEEYARKGNYRTQ